MALSTTPGSVGISNPISAIDRLPNVSGAVSGPVVNTTLVSQRNRAMEKISAQARRLRQGLQAGGTVDVSKIGRNDSMEQLCVRLGIIPILNLPHTSSLTTYVQTYAPRRPAGTELITISGGAATTTMVAGDPLKPYGFTAAGPAQPETASDSVDTGAKGRALVDVLP
jgi:hypothetical protein